MLNISMKGSSTNMISDYSQIELPCAVAVYHQIPNTGTKQQGRGFASYGTCSLPLLEPGCCPQRSFFLFWNPDLAGKACCMSAPGSFTTFLTKWVCTTIWSQPPTLAAQLYFFIMLFWNPRYPLLVRKLNHLSEKRVCLCYISRRSHFQENSHVSLLQQKNQNKYTPGKKLVAPSTQLHWLSIWMD